MRSTNPVLTRTDFGLNQYAPPADQFNGSWYAPPMTQRMTLADVISKTSGLFLVLVATAIASAMIIPIQFLMGATIVCSLAAFVTSIVVAGRRKVSLPGVLAFTIFEGVFVGGFSKLFELLYPGIVVQAVLGTFMAAAATFIAYRFGNVRVRGRLARIVTIAVFAYAGVALVNLVMLLFGTNLGIFNIGPSAGMLSWLAAGIGVVLAVASLVMDFDEVDRGIRMGAPAQESWRAAFGLMVTMVWLYTQILRIASFFYRD